MINLAVELPTLLPAATSWIESQQTGILAAGRALTPTEIALARVVGVRDPDRVRFQVVQALPQPSDPRLRAAAAQIGLLGPGTAGITFGYGVYIVEGHLTNRLASHELRHVHQYEASGSIANFLTTYLHQIVTVGYAHAALEVDARAHEREVP